MSGPGRDRDPDPGPDADVDVVGAGIAGLTLAVALRARGLGVRVHEADDEHRTVGAGIQLAPNAVRLLDALGLGARLRDRATAIERTELRRWRDGRVLGTVGLGRESEIAFGAPLLTLHRADLHRALLAALAPEVVRTGHRLVDVRPGPPMSLGFADAASCRARVLVGADGVTSRVGRLLAGGVAASPTGHVIHRRLLPAHHVPGELADPVLRVWIGPGAHAVTYPVDLGRRVSVAVTTRHATLDPRAFEDWAPALRTLLTRGGEPWRAWPVVDGVPAGVRDRGPVTVIGDAAHPFAPFAAQGAGQAVEDAAVLAHHLADHCGAAALRAHERDRQERVRAVREYSLGQAAWLHLPDGPAQRRRDERLAGGGRAAMAWLYGHDPLPRTAAPVRSGDRAADPALPGATAHR